MDPLAIILLSLATLIVANLAAAITCRIVSRRGAVPGWLRLVAGILLLLDLPPLLIALPGVFAPNHDEVLSWNWAGIALTIMAFLLIPGLFLWYSAFKPHSAPAPPE